MLWIYCHLWVRALDLLYVYCHRWRQQGGHVEVTGAAPNDVMRLDDNNKQLFTSWYLL